jgi:hypothetical protein
MRRSIQFIAGLGIGMILALPGASAAQVAQDSVVGSGTTEFSFAFDLNARSGPSGENPTGTARVVLRAGPTIGIQGPVTCLTVTGNRAVIGLDNSQGFSALGRGWFIEVTDDTPDSLAVSSFSLVAAPTVCPSSLGLEQERVDSGDIVVTDAPPFPTSKEQCKDGGWRTFGVFKNQGDCVSFVASKGNNPPASP